MWNWSGSHDHAQCSLKATTLLAETQDDMLDYQRALPEHTSQIVLINPLEPFSRARVEWPVSQMYFRFVPGHDAWVERVLMAASNKWTTTPGRYVGHPSTEKFQSDPDVPGS